MSGRTMIDLLARILTLNIAVTPEMFPVFFDQESVLYVLN